MIAIRTRALRKLFRTGFWMRPVEGVKNVDLEVKAGEIFGFIGPNGAGKTTTIKMLTGLVLPTSGEAWLNERPVSDPSSRARLGFLPEGTFFHDYLDAREFLDFHGALLGIPRELRRERIPKLLERVGLAHAADRQIRRYSKGMRQRVGLAQALLGDPEVLILDEPTIGLDPRQIAEIRALIRSLAGQHTVILSTHILPEVSMVCDGVIIINQGRIVAQGTEAELVEQVFPAARIEVRVAGASGDVAAAFGAIPAVTRVEPLPPRDDGIGVLVESPRDRDVRPELVKLVANRGWRLQELHQVGMSLEEVFIRVVAGEETHDGVVTEEPA